MLSLPTPTPPPHPFMKTIQLSINISLLWSSMQFHFNRIVSIKFDFNLSLVLDPLCCIGSWHSFPDSTAFFITTPVKLSLQAPVFYICYHHLPEAKIPPALGVKWRNYMIPSQALFPSLNFKFFLFILPAWIASWYPTCLGEVCPWRHETFSQRIPPNDQYSKSFCNTSRITQSCARDSSHTSKYTSILFLERKQNKFITKSILFSVRPGSNSNQLRK